MSASAHALFGDAPRDEAATPGSYGEPPRGGRRLPGATRLGPVRLQVADLGRSLAFYERVLGLRVAGRGPGRAALAAGATNGGTNGAPVLVELAERPGARPAARRGRLGLYHLALLLPDRSALGRFVRHLGELGAPAGAGDHLVSEAFYLTDPDGLGIEVYADRPRAAWRRVGRELMMATDPVDVPALVRAAGDAPWEAMPAGTVVGHVHLHVGDLDAARRFYGDGLGFDRTAWSYPGALFFGAGGYHHHLGTNTWAGPGAGPPADGDARLVEWTVELPNAADVDAAAASLAAVGHAVGRADAGGGGGGGGRGVVARDPWGTAVRLRVA